MVLKLHRSEERGIAEQGWLHSRFSFSFADYHNRERMGFGALRVINDDIIEPSGVFGMHPHRDMEIITIVTKGLLEHEDSEGNHGFITAGEIQYMSAGSGVHHSEFNPSDENPVELFQIWIHPSGKGLSPRYEKRDFRSSELLNSWVLLVSHDGREGSMPIRQDASILSAHLEEGKVLVSMPSTAKHGRLLLVIEGAVKISEHILGRRDELQVIGDDPFEITALSDARMLLFDVPMKF